MQSRWHLHLCLNQPGVERKSDQTTDGSMLNPCQSKEKEKEKWRLGVKRQRRKQKRSIALLALLCFWIRLFCCRFNELSAVLMKGFSSYGVERIVESEPCQTCLYYALYKEYKDCSSPTADEVLNKASRVEPQYTRGTSFKMNWILKH